jgi:hypothetical protein
MLTPLRASARAMFRPKPRLAPVTRAIFVLLFPWESPWMSDSACLDGRKVTLLERKIIWHIPRSSSGTGE